MATATQDLLPAASRSHPTSQRLKTNWFSEKMCHGNPLALILSSADHLVEPDEALSGAECAALISGF